MSSNDVRKRSKEGREEAQDLGNSTSTQLGKAAGKGAGRASSVIIGFERENDTLSFYLFLGPRVLRLD